MLAFAHVEMALEESTDSQISGSGKMGSALQFDEELESLTMPPPSPLSKALPSSPQGARVPSSQLEQGVGFLYLIKVICLLQHCSLSRCLLMDFDFACA